MAGRIKVSVLGNLGRDPELKYSAKGSAILKFSAAATSREKNRDGGYDDHTEWVSVTVFGKQAEFLSERLTKGVRVLIDGRLTTRQYETSAGKAGFSLDVIADDVAILDKVERRAAADADVEDEDDLPI